MIQESRRPIFIVGCPRSGTTLLRLFLDSHPNLSCGPETGFLTDMADLADKYAVRLKRFGLEPHDWYDRTATFFHDFQSDYSATRHKSRWVDKTPQYTLRLDLLNQLFPRCQIVHIIRNGRDVVDSYHRRWGYLSAIKTAANRWQDHISQARRVGKSMPKDRYYELRYEDLVTDPEPTLRSIFDFLGEPWVPDVLHYDQHPHDNSERYTTATQAFRTKNDDLVYKSRIDKKLDPFLSAIIQVRSGKLLNDLGY